MCQMVMDGGADGQVSFGVGDWVAFAIALATPSLLSSAAFKPQPKFARCITRICSIAI